MFKQPLFKNTLINALDIVIDTIFVDEEHRTKLRSRFLNMIEKTSEVSIAVACKGDTEDEKFPYYYAVVDAKSFGKYFIPTYKPVPSEDTPSPPSAQEPGKK